ncbi:H+-ATPase G subunit-domain-containing protein [Tuber borchii]|uniref:V-type proton ATPase subunit G n=1 Tax=Tuber borchii TaxID=42251 RepID=A0A2T7A9D2_TUBBO|nr:H+-ATPase G subunit-domain-containing protein [Tuber borchii]
MLTIVGSFVRFQQTLLKPFLEIDQSKSSTSRSHTKSNIMSVQNSAGIQTLLDAEREAQKIVQKARAYRTQKVKDARSEAQKEIEEYKKQKENEFKEFESKHSGANAKAEEEATKEIEQTLKDIEAATKEKGPEVIGDLLKAVTDVKPEPHRNVAASA